MRSLLLWGAILVGCTGPSDRADPRVLSGPLSIDSAFSEEQQQEVIAAVDMWSEATGGLFQPELRIEEVECGQAFGIEAVAQRGCRVGQSVDDSEDERGLRVLGSASRGRHTVAVVSWLDGASFRNNVAHELGHYLLMGHGNGIMAQQREGQPPVVTDANLREFCRVWQCESETF